MIFSLLPHGNEMVYRKKYFIKKIQGADWKRYSTLYAKVRKEVFKRDKHRCRYPKCNSRLGIQAHHIIRHADCGALAFSKDNMITLCKKHHKEVTGKETFYIELFRLILRGSSDNNTR